jgi:Flp pilus assembly protein TadB
MDFQLLVSLFVLAVALVMIFAQVRLFSIDNTLKQIQRQLAAPARIDPSSQAEVPASLQTEVPPSLAKLAEKSEPSSAWVLVFVIVGCCVLGLALVISSSSPK